MTSSNQSTRPRVISRLLDLNLVLSIISGFAMLLLYSWLRYPLDIHLSQTVRVFLVLCAYIIPLTIYLKYLADRREAGQFELLGVFVFMVSMEFLGTVALGFLPKGLLGSWLFPVLGLISIMIYLGGQFGRLFSSGRLAAGAGYLAGALIAALVVITATYDGLILHRPTGSGWWNTLQGLPWAIMQAKDMQWPALAFWIIVSVAGMWLYCMARNRRLMQSHVLAGFAIVLAAVLYAGFFISEAALFKSEIPWSYEAQLGLIQHIDSAFNQSMARGISDLGYTTTALDGTPLHPYHFASQAFYNGIGSIAGIDYPNLLTVVQYMFINSYLLLVAGMIFVVAPLGRYIEHWTVGKIIGCSLLTVLVLPVFFLYAGPQFIRSIPSNTGFVFLVAGSALVAAVWFRQAEISWKLIGLLLLCTVAAVFSKVSFGYLLASITGWVLLRSTGFSLKTWTFSIIAIFALLLSYLMFWSAMSHGGSHWSISFPVLQGLKNSIIDPLGRFNWFLVFLLALICVFARKMGSRSDSATGWNKWLELQFVAVLFSLIPVVVIQMAPVDMRYFYLPVTYLSFVLGWDRIVGIAATGWGVASVSPGRRVSAGMSLAVIILVLVATGFISAVNRPLQFPARLVAGADMFINEVINIYQPDLRRRLGFTPDDDVVAETLRMTGFTMPGELEALFGQSAFGRIFQEVERRKADLLLSGYQNDEIALLIPREITPARYEIKGRNRVGNVPCRKFGFQLYAWTGIPQIMGVAAGEAYGLCPDRIMRDYGYGNYDIDVSRSRSASDLSLRTICDHAVKLGYSAVVVIDSIEPEVSSSVKRCELK